MHGHIVQVEQTISYFNYEKLLVARRVSFNELTQIPSFDEDKFETASWLAQVYEKQVSVRLILFLL